MSPAILRRALLVAAALIVGALVHAVYRIIGG